MAKPTPQGNKGKALAFFVKLLHFFDTEGITENEGEQAHAFRDVAGATEDNPTQADNTKGQVMFYCSVLKCHNST